MRCVPMYVLTEVRATVLPRRPPAAGRPLAGTRVGRNVERGEGPVLSVCIPSPVFPFSALASGSWDRWSVPPGPVLLSVAALTSALASGL